MSAEIVNIFDYKKQPPTINAQESLHRWMVAAACGDDVAAERHQTDYYRALFGDWPVGDKPCDTE